jgi:hypothetical protein
MVLRSFKSPPSTIRCYLMRPPTPKLTHRNCCAVYVQHGRDVYQFTHMANAYIQPQFLRSFTVSDVRSYLARRGDQVSYPFMVLVSGRIFQLLRPPFPILTISTGCKATHHRVDGTTGVSLYNGSEFQKPIPFQQSSDFDDSYTYVPILASIFTYSVGKIMDAIPIQAGILPLPKKLHATHIKAVMKHAMRLFNKAIHTSLLLSTTATYSARSLHSRIFSHDSIQENIKKQHRVAARRR